MAVQSHFFSAGSVVPWVEPGVGAVATQATAEVAHGPGTLAQLRDGHDPAEALRLVLDADPQASVRQLAAVDATGRAAAHTGSECIVHAGHVTGDGFSVQANMMLDPGVPEAMATAFAADAGSLAARGCSGRSTPPRPRVVTSAAASRPRSWSWTDRPRSSRATIA